MRRPGGQTVLIVEDEAMIRSNVRECLQQLGYQVSEAENGEAALQDLRRVFRAKLISFSRTW